MSRLIIKLLIFVWFLNTGWMFVYAQEFLKPAPKVNAPFEVKPLYASFYTEYEAEAHKYSQTKSSHSFFDFIEKMAYASAVEKNKEKRKLREAWEEVFGVDIFYPYFKAKEVEDWVSEKLKVQVFNVKGKPKFDENSNQVKYIFNIKF